MKVSIATTIAFQTCLVGVESISRELLDVFDDFGQPDPAALKIDLDQRSIVGRTAQGTDDGLGDAEVMYKEGLKFAPETLQSLITGDNVFRDFDLYVSFTDFFGGDQFYADTWIQAAFDNSNINMGDKNFNFRELTTEGRSIAVRWGTVVLNVFMGVVSSMNQAVDQCSSSSRDALLQWGNAFAYYTGSMAESEFPLGGYLLYNLAQTQCEKFGTCKKGEESPVNKQILKYFVEGKDYISSEQCNLLNAHVFNIQALMTVPLIQGTLEASYAMDLQDDIRHKVQGEAAAFSTAVAPIISACNVGNGRVIYKDLSPGSGVLGSFEVVKAAFERSYDCLDITCEDVGGLIGPDGTYLMRAEACDNVQPVEGAGSNPDFKAPNTSVASKPESADDKTRWRIGLGFGLPIGIVSLLIGIAIGRRSVRKREKEFDTSTDSPEKLAAPEVQEVLEGNAEVDEKTKDMEVL